MNKFKIPKVIHYCWFGRGEKSELIINCINSWKEKLPDYEIIEWNEDNFDINMIDYTKEAYEAKKYAFVSDYARLWIVNNYGGIYLDTDVEVLRNLDEFIDDPAFMAFEGNHGVNPGLIFGSKKNNLVLDEIMKIYHESSFIMPNQTNNITTIVQNTTKVLLRYGLILDCNLTQTIKDIKIYAVDYFNPDKETRDSKNYGKNTYTAHHYNASWVTKEHKKRLKNPIWLLTFKTADRLGKVFRKVLGQNRWEKVRNKYLMKIYNFIRGQ